MDRNLVLLDEPTNGLDPEARIRMLQLVREIRDTGEVSVLISSHLLRDIEECCDQVLILKEGRIAALCNLEEERKANLKFLELGSHAGQRFSGVGARIGLRMRQLWRRTSPHRSAGQY